MPFAISEDEHLSDAKFAKVQVGVHVPWVYRQQLHKLARKRGVSMNRLVVDALYSMIPPE